MSTLQLYAKFFAAVLGAALVSASQAFPDNSVVANYGPLVLSIVTAVAVYVIPNKPASPTNPGAQP